MKFTVLTFGCQMNVSDSERIHTMLKQAGFEHEQDMEHADLIILNTCSVKQKAEDKAWGQVMLADKIRKKKNPNIRIGITGCMVRQSGVRYTYGNTFRSKDPLFLSSKRLDFVFRIEDLVSVPKYLSVLYNNNIGDDYSDELESYFSIKPEYASAFQVFVPVQTGCDKFCTYCIVPFTRKREVCRPQADILKEVEELVQKGAKEVTLLGQTVNSYKHSDCTQEYSENNFVELLYHINKIPGLDRIRYTSPHPMDMDDELIRAHVELDKVCKHVHMPLQSGDDFILKKMNRKYTTEQYRTIIQKLRNAVPDIAITTDIIVGFCEETEEHFQNSYDMFKEIGFDMSFTSRYSARKGTYSDRRMEDMVTPDEKANRWHRLNELLKETSFMRNKPYEGSYQPILVERRLDTGKYEGMTRTNKRVQFVASDPNLIGEIVPVKILRAREFHLEGEKVGR